MGEHRRFRGCMDVEQIALVYPEIEINEQEKKENIMFGQRMKKMKLDKMKKKESSKFINKMLTAIKNKTKKFQIRKTKKCDADVSKLEAGECTETLKQNQAIPI